MKPNESSPTAGDAASPAVSADAVIDVAVGEFSRLGYPDARLDAVARESGMSKRMIHYHFGDKRGLYLRAVGRAVELLHPPEDELRLDSSVPVEGVRKLVDAMYRQFTAHPEAVRLVVMENFYRVAAADELASLTEGSSITLHLDRLLLLGQDSGAFRPGISANDIYALITSIIFYRQINRSVTADVFQIDMMDEHNTEGIHRLLVDVVLAFLTANIPDSGRGSYLSVSAPPQSDRAESDSTGTLYDENASLSDELFIDDE